MKVAITHDYLHQFGGAEKVALALHELFPEAPMFTSIYNKKNFSSEFNNIDIRVSFMQKLPFIFNNFRAYLPLYPFAFQSFNLQEYDLIISSSSAFAKGIKKRKDAKHICYCHNPMRFAWQYNDYIKHENIPKLLKYLLPFVVFPIKMWDRNNSCSVDYFIANSEEIAERIKTAYKRDSEVIYPPINVSDFHVSSEDRDYYLIVSRLVHYKRIDLAVLAFSKLNLPLKIAGDGPARKKLEGSAFPNIEFLGGVDDHELKELYSKCKALIVTGCEDFGMAPLEAAASGRPTIAYQAGGALETIIDKKTGLFFKEQTVESLIETVLQFNNVNFDKKAIRFHAEMYDKRIFKDKLRRFLNENKIL